MLGDESTTPPSGAELLLSCLRGAMPGSAPSECRFPWSVSRSFSRRRHSRATRCSSRHTSVPSARTPMCKASGAYGCRAANSTNSTARAWRAGYRGRARVRCAVHWWPWVARAQTVHTLRRVRTARAELLCPPVKSKTIDVAGGWGLCPLSSRFGPRAFFSFYTRDAGGPGAGREPCASARPSQDLCQAPPSSTNKLEGYR
jgi:hypothetical protein